MAEEILIPVSPDSRELNYELIPDELKRQNIWLVAAHQTDSTMQGKAPHTDVNGKLVLCDYNDKNNLMPFSIANTYANKFGYAIGIVLNGEFDYCVTDLDIKGEHHMHRLDNFKQIMSSFGDTYIEQSVGGMGFHIISKCERMISRNAQDLGIEVYSYKRFIVLTGNIVSAIKDKEGNIEIEKTYEFVTDNQLTNDVLKRLKPRIEYRNELIDNLLESLSLNGDTNYELSEVAEEKSDDDVISDIMESAWMETFLKLTMISESTNVSILGYPSASEADMALIGILVHFTPSNEQIRRIFRMYPLSFRDKHNGRNPNYRIDRCIIRARADLDNSQIDAFCENATKTFEEASKRTKEEEAARIELMREQYGESYIDNLSSDTDKVNPFKVDIPFPHGLIGDVAKFIHDSSHNKLKEASIAAALALFSGICGRQWRYRNVGLNNYFVVIALSGMGKETVSNSIGRIGSIIAKANGNKHICADKISSGQALKTAIRNSETYSIIALMPEFARLVDSIKSNNEAMRGFGAELLDAYSKSAEGSSYGGSVHAKIEDNRDSVLHPAFSLIGDCTPDYYDGVTLDMQSNGFLSRFINIEHYGHLKYLSDDEAHTVQLRSDIADRLCDLVRHATKLRESFKLCSVGYDTPLTAMKVREFEQFIINETNKTTDEQIRQPFNRAFIKVMKIASLLAVAERSGDPVITLKDFEWAKGLIMRDVFNILSKVQDGTLGISEENSIKRAKDVILKLTNPKYKRDKVAEKFEQLLDRNIVTRSVLSHRLKGNTFRIGNLSAGRTLDYVLDEMIKNGQIRPVTGAMKEAIVTGTMGAPFNGACYEVLFNKKEEVND